MYSLRLLLDQDLESLLDSFGYKDLNEYLGITFAFGVDDRRCYDNYVANYGNCLRCVITEEETGTIQGLVSLTGVDFFDGSANINILIRQQTDRDEELLEFALLEMLHHAFHGIDLHVVRPKTINNKALFVRVCKNSVYI